MKRILDGSFHYVPSYQTDLRKTFERLRRGAARSQGLSMIRVLALIGLIMAAPAYAAQDFGACLPVEAGSAGTVEAVREVPVPRDLHAFDADVLEHRIRVETAEQLVVRLDSGPLVVVTYTEPHRAESGLQAGQRVRIALDGSTARIQREAAYCSMAPLAGLGQRLF